MAGDYPDQDIDMCSSLMVCWVSALTAGLRFGDIGAVMEPRPSTDPTWLFLVLCA